MLLLVLLLGVWIRRLKPWLNGLSHDDLTGFKIFDHLTQSSVLVLKIDDFFAHFMSCSILIFDISLLLRIVLSCSLSLLHILIHLFDELLKLLCLLVLLLKTL